MTDWFAETLFEDFQTSYKVERVLYDTRSAHQRIVLFEHKVLGRVLTLDGVIQTTERDEFIYHEMLSHVPILAHGKARSVLVIGGGDGGMVEEVLKHRGIERATLVEIDAAVVEFAKKYLPTICGDAFDDPRFHLVIADGAAFVAETEERFDIIIIDSTDPIGPGESLFTESFYAGCRRALREGGVLVTQNGVPFLQADELKSSLRALKGLFADTGCFLAAVPTYVGGVMAFAWASDDPALRRTPLEVLDERFRAAGIETRYYTPEVHRASFALPPFVQDLID